MWFNKRCFTNTESTEKITKDNLSKSYNSYKSFRPTTIILNISLLLKSCVSEHVYLLTIFSYRRIFFTLFMAFFITTRVCNVAAKKAKWPVLCTYQQFLSFSSGWTHQVDWESIAFPGLQTTHHHLMLWQACMVHFYWQIKG